MKPGTKVYLVAQVTRYQDGTVRWIVTEGVYERKAHMPFMGTMDFVLMHSHPDFPHVHDIPLGVPCETKIVHRTLKSANARCRELANLMLGE